MAFHSGELNISPNFNTEFSQLAEERMFVLIEKAREIGVELFFLEHDRETILNLVKEKAPHRFDLVVEKLQEEGISLDQLSQEVLLDRILGIDHALIIRLRQDISEDVILDLFSRVERFAQDNESFSAIVKYPETQMKKKKGRL